MSSNDVPPPGDDPTPRRAVTTQERGGETDRAAHAKVSRVGDRAMTISSTAASAIIVLAVAFVALFLTTSAVPALLANNANFFGTNEWTMDPNNLRFGILGLLWTTVLTSTIALLLAVPVSVGIALLITHYTPKRIGQPIAFVVDLLAAVPSVIFGLWGFQFLAPFLRPFSEFLRSTVGAVIPGFRGGLAVPDGSAFTAGIVLAIMILPIITALCRDSFAQTPRDEIEASLALGATRWEVMRMAVLPHGRSGVVAAAMLGLGRALGETIAVMIILSTPGSGPIDFSIFAGGETFASTIASNQGEFSHPLTTGAYIAAGLTLFLITFVVNALARVVADSGKAK
ncbi:phosphate ABC transporter permease subunit PstC [Parenemella sanctibonifatiensis]|uniref:Phosphate transport system permease protein n=1 Tax=Parenemella sanctibonifatiensis TaxID=2016505 RepID=A0A255ESF6_9ACTN|nr:phosphate ABC transporter permease subunit PstC [Parenemella sanctibonifatiensis]